MRSRTNEAEFRLARQQHARYAPHAQTATWRLYSLLRTSIYSGELAPDDALSETELMRDHGASRNSTREALALLARDGLVSRTPRRGTAVISGIRTLSVEGFTAPVLGPGSTATSRALDHAEVPSTPMLGRKLGTDDTSVLMYEVVIAIDDKPFVLYTGYTRVTDRPLSFEGYGTGWDLRTAFARSYDTPLVHVEAHVSAMPCEARAARTLQVQEGRPVFLRGRLLIDGTGTGREYSYTHTIDANVVYQSRTRVA